MNKKMYSIITIILIILILGINLYFYQQLPEKIGMQINTSGDLRNHMPKNLFIFIAPLVVLVFYVISLFNEKKEYGKTFIVGIIMFLLNIFTIIMNT